MRSWWLKMKVYIKKIIDFRGKDYDYRLFFKDEYGNLYGGIRSFKTWADALKFGKDSLK